MNKQTDECGGAGDERGKRGQAEAELQAFVQDMAAQQFFLTDPERRAARAMLAEGFCSVEVAAFLQASPWAAYYRNCVREHHLPESTATRDVLRKSFELGESGRVAAQRAIEAMRRNADEMFSPVNAPIYLDQTAHIASVELEIELFGRAHSRDKRWPTWMRELTQGRSPSID